MDITKEDDSNDGLWKVRPLLTSFQQRCQNITLEERLCIDEQIIQFKGKLYIKHYVTEKLKPWGVKVFMLCIASGTIYDFLIYQGSSTHPN